MGKTKKLFQAKRILALILAVTMTVTMVPSTAMAAPAGDNALVSVEPDGNITGTDQEETSPAADNSVAGDDASGGGESATTEEDVAETENTATDGDVVETENTVTDGEAAGTESSVTEDNEPAADSAVAEDQTAEGVENVETTAEGDAAPAAKPTYRILTDEVETTAEYTGGEVFGDILDQVKLEKTQDGKTEKLDASDEGVTCVWKQKGTDGNFAPMASGLPVNAGSYQAVFSFAKVEGVHDGAADATVDLEITKAPATVHVTATAKPGTTSVKESVKAVVSRVDSVNGDLTEEDIALEIMGLRDAITGNAPDPAGRFAKDDDYVVDIRPSFKAGAAADKQAVYNNYRLEESFPVDVTMGELTETRVQITLAEKWKDAEAVTTQAYDGAEVKAPEENTDYTYEVQFKEDGTGAWKKLDAAAKAVGEWCAEDEETGEMTAVPVPVDAGTYKYRLVYQDVNGEYDESEAVIDVVVDPATVVVTFKNTTAPKIPAGMTMAEVLSRIDYEAKTTDRTGKEIVIDPAEHIWGTGYDDSHVSQIYEPVFMLQLKDGDVWKDVTNEYYRLVGGKEYRIIFAGQKAVYNADGSYAHRTDINSGLDEKGEDIVGIDSNYKTDVTPTADDKALTFTAEPGVEATWDLSVLLADGKAGATPEDAGGKSIEYNGEPIYKERKEYKDKVKLKAGSASLDATGSDFTYTWYKNTAAEDLVDKEIMDQNKANGFSDVDFNDAWDWEALREDLFAYNVVAPIDAGIYKLEISYRDETDDGTYYYVQDNKPAEIYFVINKVQIKIDPSGAYETLAGKSVKDFFEDTEIAYQMQIAKAVGEYGPIWEVVEQTKQEGSDQVDERVYREDTDYITFISDAAKTYKIQASEKIGYWSEKIGDFVEDPNFTTKKHGKVETDVDGKKQASDKWEPLGGSVDLKVNPVGTASLTVTPNAAAPAALEKEYDGKLFSQEEIAAKVNGAYTITKADGQPVTAEEIGAEYWCEETDGEYWDNDNLQNIKDVGEYDLYLRFEGSKDYAPFADVKIGTVKITPRKLALETKVQDTYPAGPMNDVLLDARNGLQVTGYVPEEERVFAQRSEWKYGSPKFLVYEKGSKNPVEDGIIHRNKTYEVKYDESSELNDSAHAGFDEQKKPVYINCERNYEVVSVETLGEFKAVTAPARIQSTSLGEKVSALNTADPVVTIDGDGNVSQKVDILDGIAYTTYDGTDAYSKSVKMTGNLAAFSISAPAEFGGSLPDTALYQNEVEKAGGRVMYVDESNGYFTVLFDMAEKEITFTVRWEDKYTEDFTLKVDEKQLLGNLENAVAPKSLAFNAAPKKLAMGSLEQLDVKITKVQMGDIISLGYESSDDSTLYVNESGWVTALKKGKATITVYPQQMNDKGEMVRIEGAKSATTTIEAVPVTAPKPVKVSANGDYAVLDYDTPVDGYRREIYVVDNKKNPALKTAPAIEEEVKKLRGNKNQWKNSFAIAPVYLDSADENYNRKNENYSYTAWLNGLQTQGQYTVYVRNVCAAKTWKLPDGSQITITQTTVDESAAGTAVSFKTLKSEATRLDLKLDETVDGIVDLTGDYSDEGYYEPAEFYEGTRIYAVDFSKFPKGMDSTALGLFRESVIVPTAESTDYLYWKLPLKALGDKQVTDNYEEPKLEYFVETYDEKKDDYVWVQKNDYVSIDKKGKIKLTGVTNDEDYVSILVRDSNSGKTAYIYLYIVANVDAVTAKKKSVTMSVGQRIDLESKELYSYSAGGKKLTGYMYPDIAFDDALKAAVKGKEEWFELDGSYLRAIKEGGTLELSLTDRTVAKADPNKATVKITFKTKALEPVKKLKACDVMHDRFGLTFTYAGGADGFRVEIMDSSKNKILDRVYGRYNGAEELEEVSGKPVKDTYRISADTIKKDVEQGRARLSKESQYTVTVTALYDNILSKPAGSKVKTTKIPVTDEPLADYYERDEKGNFILKKLKGGMDIKVSESGVMLGEESGTSLNVLSGNSYTLTADVKFNRGRVNDTLVWTIGDKKVASVKAAAGTYCITLKGLKPGNTTLEVRSKILNKVVARYDVKVVAVGDAYKNSDGNYRYYGDNEPEDWSNPNVQGAPSVIRPEYLPLSLGNPRKVLTDKTRYFSFKAPETGRYTFQTEGENVQLWKCMSKNGSWTQVSGDSDTKDLGWLIKDETVYLMARVFDGDYWITNGSYYVGIGIEQRMETVEAGKPLTVKGQNRQEVFQFTAAESGYYQFTLSNGSNKQYLYLYKDENEAVDQNGNADKSGVTVEYSVSAGKSVWLKTDYLGRGTYTLEAKKISEDASLGTPKPVTLAAGETKYLVYAVEKDGRYEFSSTADAESYDISGEIEVNGESKATFYSNVFANKLELRQGDAVCLKVTNSGTGEMTFTVKAEDITPKDLSTAGDKIPAGSDTFYQFTAPAEGAYQFTMTVNQADAANAELKLWNSVSDAESYYGSALAESSTAVSVDTKAVISVGVLLQVGQTVYVNPINHSGSELTATVSGAQDTGMPEIKAGETGNAIEVKAGEKKSVVFKAESTGIYTFTTAALSEQVTFKLYKNGAYTGDGADVYTTVVYGESTLEEAVFLHEGQTIIWEMEAASNVNVTLGAGLTRALDLPAAVKDLRIGSAERASVLSANDAPGGQATADGAIFVVPEDGTYTFWSSSDSGSYMDTYGILYDIDSVDADTCLLHNNLNSAGSLSGGVDGGGPGNGSHFAITQALKKGQTVYLKSMCYYDGQSLTFTVHVEKGYQPWNN